MQPRSRKIAVFVGSAALATGVGVGVASQGGETSTSQAAMSQPPQGGRGMDLDTLADELGVTTAELRTALEAARPTAGGPPDPDAMAASLAEALGLSEDEVAAALEAMRPDGARPTDGTTTS